MEKTGKIESYGEMALEKLNDVLVFLDVGKQILETDRQKFMAFFGVNPNKHWLDDGAVLERDRVHPDDYASLAPKLLGLKANRGELGVEVMEFRVRSSTFDGEYFWVCCTIIPIEKVYWENVAGDEITSGKLFVCFKDINSDKAKALALLEAIKRDTNTDLFNKPHTQKSVEAKLKTDKNGALFMIDIDDFKSVNDRVGHLLGDGIILQVANKLKNMFGDDSVVGRVGGDEFVVYVSNLSKEKIILQARHILGSLGQITYGYDNKYLVSVSVGIARYPIDSAEFAGLYSCADLASYYSKLNGKNIFSLYNKLTMNWSDMKYVDERKNNDTMYETSFLKYVFQVLNESNDRKNAIEQVMLIVAQKFNANRCFYCTYDGSHVRCEFKWFANGDENKMKDLLARFESDEYLRRYQGDGIYYRNNILMANKDSVPLLMVAGIKSFLHCAIIQNNKILGFIAFESQEIYSEIDFAMLGILSKMITESILQFEVNSGIRIANKMYVNILDSLDSLAYVIDMDTNEICYYNKWFQKTFPESKKGDKCYQILRNRDCVCKDCPLYAVKEGKTARITYSKNNADARSTTFTALEPTYKVFTQALCLRDIKKK